jgi:hypothetical protein
LLQGGLQDFEEELQRISELIEAAKADEGK